VGLGFAPQTTVTEGPSHLLPLGHRLCFVSISWNALD